MTKIYWYQTSAMENISHVRWVLNIVFMLRAEPAQLMITEKLKKHQLENNQLKRKNPCDI